LPTSTHVKAYIEAFNSGDEKTFLKAEEDLMSAGTLAKRPAADRAKMFGRMKGDFGTLTVKRVAATPDKIRVVVPDRDGNEASPENVWHRPVIDPLSDWVVVSFHTATADGLIEERPVDDDRPVATASQELYARRSFR
jgi:hypothetical protein